MAIPYAKIGPDQLDLDALSQRIIAENGIVTKKDGVPSNIADEVEKMIQALNGTTGLLIVIIQRHCSRIETLYLMQ